MFNTETEQTTHPDEKANGRSFSKPEDWRPYSQIRLLNKIKQLEAEINIQTNTMLLYLQTTRKRVRIVEATRLIHIGWL